MTRTVRHVAIGLAALLGIFAAWSWYVAHPSLWPEYRQATAIIDQIEQFKAKHNRLPANLAEISAQPATEIGPIFYQPSLGSSYTVWFGRSLGESYTYDSLTGSWQ